MASIEDTLNSYPRISLTRLPTPLHPLPHLGARLGLNVSIKRDDLTDLVFGGDKPRIEIYDEFIGREYGDPTEACLDAIQFLAQTEGILLDPVYSGKMASGFLTHHAAGRWSADNHILLLHSGGTPALFAYHAEIKAHLSKRGADVGEK